MSIDTRPVAPSGLNATERIITGAAACFGMRGYRGASMQEIARCAGVAKSLLHYHFESKEHLFIEVQLDLFRGILQRVRRLAGPEGKSAQQLRPALQTVLQELEADPGRARVLLEFREVGGSSRERIRGFYDELERLIEDGVRNTLGEAVPGLRLAPDRLARQLMVFFQGILVEIAFVETEEDRGRIREAFADYATLLEHSLFARVG
jgi:AcrR family transcriptional regulator